MCWFVFPAFSAVKHGLKSVDIHCDYSRNASDAILSIKHNSFKKRVLYVFVSAEEMTSRWFSKTYDARQNAAVTKIEDVRSKMKCSLLYVSRKPMNCGIQI